LVARADWSVGALARLQTDVTAVPWRALRATFSAAEPATDGGRTIRDLLAAWDGVLSADSPAASAYELALAELAIAEAQAVAPRSWRWALGAGFGEAVPRTSFGARIVSRLVAALDADPRSLDVGAALDRAAAALTERFGTDPAAWAWGRVRPLRLLHALGLQRPLDRMLNLGPVPLGGDANTVAQAGVLPLDPLGNPAAIPNHRMVIDLGDVERSRFVLAGGQSGNPLSPHYGDLFELWQRGEGVPIAFGHDAVVAATVDRLLLRPDV
jgi:penicillin amidase